MNRMFLHVEGSTAHPSGQFISFNQDPLKVSFSNIFQLTPLTFIMKLKELPHAACNEVVINISEEETGRLLFLERSVQPWALCSAGLLCHTCFVLLFKGPAPPTGEPGPLSHAGVCGKSCPEHLPEQRTLFSLVKRPCPLCPKQII